MYNEVALQHPFLKMPHWLKSSSLILINCFLFTYPVSAQITSDGTLSVPSTVNTDNSLDFQITGGTQASHNLYHSFSEFSVPTGGSAVFLNSPNIQNIFSRVTGQNLSNIDGLIQTSGSASLFLLNPNGILFGNHASLDIGGSFVATTAESLIFQDGKVFSSVINQSSPLLSINLPIGLQFGQQAQPITVQTLPGQLVVKPQNTLALLGGDLTIIGIGLPSLISRHLAAPGGRIEVGSVDAGSLVHIISMAEGWQFNYEQVQNFRDVEMDQAFLSTGDISLLTGLPEIKSGSLNVTGRNIILSNGANLTSFTLGQQPAGDIVVNASENLILSGFKNRSSGGLFSFTVGDGSAGNIKINTQYLIIENGAAIISQTFESLFGSDVTIKGNSGNININSTESVMIRGSNLEVGNSGIIVGTRTAGNAGNININTQQLTVGGGANIQASTVTPLDARRQGLVNTGQGGTININATESTIIEGTGLSRESNTNLAVTTTVPSRIVAETQSAGNGGNINLTTGKLILDNQGQITASSLGRIGSQNTQNLQLGDAGNISVNANQIFINNQGLISAESNSGEGGNINLNASEFILLSNDNSNLNNENPYISTRAGIDDLSGGNGGNITINTPFLVSLSTDNTDIVANAFTGSGGKININAYAIFGLEDRSELTALSDINASSEFGTSGVITISRLDIDPQEAFIQLSTEIVDPESLIVQQCGATGEYAKGEFIITGRSGLPLNPLESVDSIEGLVDLRTPDFSQSEIKVKPSVTLSPIPKPIIEAQGWLKDEKGRIILTASQGENVHFNSVPCQVY